MDTDTKKAAEVLRAGGLVAFPTETVYGLGADATNPAAVAKIFAAKGRPSTNPLIVHVADAGSARRYATEWPAGAARLAERFWPGPRALVVPKAPAVTDAVTAGRQTVALRVPNHPVALELLRAFGGPVAAPSANKSNHVSPTTAAHVRGELGGSVGVILDGGPCRVGIESTVVDLTGPRPVILRPGGVPRREIEDLVGPVETFSGSLSQHQPATSPGQHARHYAPRTPAYRFDPEQYPRIPPTAHDGRPNGLVAITSRRPLQGWGWMISMAKDPRVYAEHLYQALHNLDAENVATIYVEMPPDRPDWEAVRDRITRATRPLE